MGSEDVGLGAAPILLRQVTPVWVTALGARLGGPLKASGVFTGYDLGKGSGQETVLEPPALYEGAGQLAIECWPVMLL